MIKQTKNLIYLILPILCISLFVTEDAFEQKNELKESFRTAKDHTLNGEYRQAIMIYDEILKNQPDNIQALKMKGLSLNNLDEHTSALKQYHKALQIDPNESTSNTTAIVTPEIPRYVSATSGTYNLRDTLDFRPRVKSNANTNETAITNAAVNPVANTTR